MRILGATVTAALLALVAACASQPPATSRVAVPDKLAPGPNESLALIVPARGVQSYECRARRDQAGGYERVDAPGGEAIPWLLLAAKSVGPAGSFSRVTSVQRVRTVWGRRAGDRLCASHGRDDGPCELHGGLLLLHRPLTTLAASPNAWRGVHTLGGAAAREDPQQEATCRSDSW